MHSFSRPTAFIKASLRAERCIRHRLRHHLSQYAYCLLHAGNALDDKHVLSLHLFDVTETCVTTHIVEDGAEEWALVEGTVIVRHKLHLHDMLLQHQFLATQSAAEPAQYHHHHEFLALGGHRAEPVLHTLAVSLKVLVGLYVVKLAV